MTSLRRHIWTFITQMILTPLLFSFGLPKADAQISGVLKTQNYYDYQLRFNRKIRKDLQPLTPDQRQAVRATTYNSGDISPTELMEEIAPKPDDENSQAKLTQVTRSQCLWLPDGEPLNLSWEVVASFQSPDVWLGADGRATVGSCSFKDPVTRTPIIYTANGDPVPGAFFENDIAPIVELYRGTRVADAYDSCDPSPTSNLFIAGTIYGHDVPTVRATPANFCQSPSGAQIQPNALCSLDCFVQPDFLGDTQFSLQLRKYNPALGVSGQHLEDQILWDELPLVKKVSTTRTLARPMTPDKSGLSFTWSTPDVVTKTPDGDVTIWKENFSPTLFVSEVRVFTPNPFEKGAKVYLRPDKLDYDTLDLYVGNSSCTQLYGNPPRFGAQTDGCTSLGLVTPTYPHDSPNRKLIWKVTFKKLPMVRVLKGIAVKQFKLFPNDVYIEFVVQVTSALPQVEISPPLFDFGGVNPQQAFTAFPDPLKMDNIGYRSAIHANAWFEGTDASFFHLTPGQQSSSFPTNIPPRTSGDYVMGIQGPIPLSQGQWSRDLATDLIICYAPRGSQVDLRQQANCQDPRATRVVRRILARVGAGELNVFYPSEGASARYPGSQYPQSLFVRSFSAGNLLSSRQDERGYIRPIFIENVGPGTTYLTSVVFTEDLQRHTPLSNSPFRIFTPQLSDDHRVSRIIFSGSASQNFSQSQFPLASGESAEFWVEYAPASVGNHHAMMAISSTEGTTWIELSGASADTNVQ